MNARSVWLILLLAACKPDADGDGFPDGKDCDDANTAVSPDAPEICNGLDDNCDGQVDEDVALLLFADADGDSYGDPAQPIVGACSVEAGTVADDTDCDDGAPDTHPNADEVCGGADEDCDGLTDDDDPSVTQKTAFYEDVDEDGFGDDAVSEEKCVPSEGFVAAGGDCDDDDDSLSPDAVEACNDIDDDCDGLVDAADDDVVGASMTYLDEDLDGYGDDDTYALRCEGGLPTGGDCDDTRSDVSPSEVETCDGVDNDCDGGEAGLASWVSRSTGETDVTAVLTGTVLAPVRFTPASDGTLYLCEGTWYLSLSIAHNVTIEAPWGSDLTTVTTGGLARLVDITKAVNVTLSGLTLADGGATACGPSLDGVYTSGSAVCCPTASTVTGDDLVIRDHSTGFGAITVDQSCDMTLSSSTFTANTSSFGPTVAAVFDGSLTFIDGSIADNSSDYGGGAAYAGGADALLVLDHTLVEHNAGASIAGAVAAENDAAIACYGDGDGIYGFHANDGGTAGGAVWLNSASFVSESCDFGDPGSSENNAPDDVYLFPGGATFPYGEDASFSCDATGCK